MKLLGDLRRDLVLGIRLLARHPGFSAVSIATLAVAIGGNTAVFTIVNALLLTPPPVAEPARLARIHTGQSQTSWPIYEDIRDRTDIFVGVGASRFATANLEMGGESARLRAQVTSTNYLTVLGVPAERGRVYSDDASASGQVVVAHHIWQQHFGADPDIVGRTVRLNGRSLQVAGVMPRGFRGLVPPGLRVDIWLAIDSPNAPALQNRLLSQFEIVGRLKPGVEHSTATAALRTMAQRLRLDYPELPESLLSTEAASIEGVHAFRGMGTTLLPIFGFLALLTVISGFVLVIGCTNIAGLLVGRSALRQRELAVRMSLGSSAGRLFRQLLTESLVLALAGGVAGLLLAFGLVNGVRVAVARLPTPIDLQFAIDGRVLAYVLLLSTLTTLLFGLLPARSALRVDLVSSLKIDSSGSLARQRLRRMMVTAQIAICAALVIWSTLFLRSLGNIHTIDPGFDPSGIVMSTIQLDRTTIDAERGSRILTEWTERVAAAPGVQTASLATIIPLALAGREGFDVSLPTDAPGTGRRITASRVSPGWFATVRIPLVVGRDFSWNDREGSPDVVIVNETLARQFWNGSALGQQLIFGDRSHEVVGVAKDSKYRTLGEVTSPLVYLPFAQHYMDYVTLLARTSDARATASAMASELDRLVPGVQGSVESMSEAVAVAILPARIGAAVTGIFAGVAVALAACGVYALVAFGVLQRTREIGIRRAVGATAADIVRLILAHHGRLMGAGLVIGGAIGTLGATVMRAFLAGVGPADPVALLASAVIVGAAALVASTLPAFRATRVDPMVALRDT